MSIKITQVKLDIWHNSKPYNDMICFFRLKLHRRHPSTGGSSACRARRTRSTWSTTSSTPIPHKISSADVLHKNRKLDDLSQQQQKTIRKIRSSYLALLRLTTRLKIFLKFLKKRYYNPKLCLTLKLLKKKIFQTKITFYWDIETKFQLFKILLHLTMIFFKY